MESLASNALYLLLFLLLFPYLTKGQGLFLYSSCNTAINYTSGSVYEGNLNTTLASLAANAPLTGFNVTTVGQNPDLVYGLVQCRGDISKEDCQICANTSAVEISQLCHNQKQASIAYDYCSLQYADRPFFSTVRSSPMVSFINPQDVTEPVLFNRHLGNLVKKLSFNASSNPFKFAVGGFNYTDFVDIYAMTECTRDLEENSCLTCLQEITSYIPECCDGKFGAGIFSISCALRYNNKDYYGNLRYGISSPPPPLERNSTSAGRANSTSPDGKKNTSRTIIIVATPVAVALVVISVICGGFLWRKMNRQRVGVLEDGEKSMESLLISLSTLRIATRNFSDAYKLGVGGFGPVYKGKLFDGREIAVKRLSSSSGQGLEELKTEVMLIAKLQHRNLVRLLGFCLEEEKLLVYEYLPNGSLDKILFDQSKRFSLEWEKRYKIIVGIARGLLYLHEDSLLRIVHRDLKASNILLDEHMNPKISDFGLARLLCGSQIQGNTRRIAGTHGYMAPEYVMNGHFSTKSDVYSFGVLVLEIVAGRKNFSFLNSMNLQSYAWQHWANGTALELMDPTLQGDQWPRHEVSKCIHIGLLCVQEAAADRPTMLEIVLMLNSNTITSPVPSRPAFFVLGENFDSDVVREDPDASQFGQSKPESLQQSVNEVTISELDPRP